MDQVIGFLGFGEAAQAFVGDPRWIGSASAFDIKTETALTRSSKLADYAANSVVAARDAPLLAQTTNSIFSLVTADAAHAAAESVAPNLGVGSFFFDMNSVAPNTKLVNAERIQHQGATYIDVAIMSPVYPARLDVPLLVSGSAADRGRAMLMDIGFQNVRIAGETIGDAAAIKMIRSVMIKGIEALTAECLLAARAAGVVDDLLRALGDDWAARADYNFDRMLVHGKRRAAEMEEVCKTLSDLGIDPRMSQATVAWQRELGVHSDAPPPATLEAKLSHIQSDSKVDAA